MKLRQKQLREYGFTQRKPKEPGIYFYAEEHELADFACPSRLREGWDVAMIFWKNKTYPDTYDAGTPKGIWYMETLSGMNMCWRKGMWIKGPLHPWRGSARVAGVDLKPSAPT